jgi:glycosyltransferase involved in cell wall biosynthesis
MHVTVCVCTRDRGTALVETLRSLAASAYDDFDVVVVDQSVSETTERVARAFTLRDGRYRYAPSTTVGLSAARNVALGLVEGPLVAFTDDDCVVDAGWLAAINQAFTEHAEAGQVCGAVRAAAHDASLGFVPDFVPSRVVEVRTPWLKWRCRGIGANMAFRLSALQAVGPFDEVLGAGAPLHSAEDNDITYRMLKAGYSVLGVPEAIVTHHGFRAWDDASRLMRHSGFGMGAAYVKHLRLGDVAVLPTLLHDSMQAISWPKLLRLQRGSGLAYCAAYARGALASWRYGVDRRTCVYVMRARERSVRTTDSAPTVRVTEHA